MAAFALNEEIISSRYVLFVGAGASAPLGLKPTGPFLRLLPAKLHPLVRERERKDFTEEDFSRSVEGLFGQAARHFGAASPDCEVVLDYIDCLADVCRELNSLPSQFRELAGTGGAGGLHAQWADMFLQLRGYIQEVIVQHYSKVNGERALSIYQDVLQALCEPGQMLPIYTTNYDWVFEHLAEAGEEKLYLEDGFKESPVGEHWDRKVFKGFHPHGGKINLVLFKLHGSTSWYRDPDTPHLIRKVHIPAPQLAGSRAVLIYPTQRKAPATQEEPFQTAYDYLQETMMHTKLGVIIGFSFRDPAINDTLRYTLSKNKALKLVVVEPKIDETDGVSFEQLLARLGIDKGEWQQRMRVIKGYFGDDPLVYEKIAETAQKLDEWNRLEHWVANLSRSA